MLFGPTGHSSDLVAKVGENRDCDAADAASGSGDHDGSAGRLDPTLFKGEHAHHRGEPRSTDTHGLHGAHADRTAVEPHRLDFLTLGVSAPVTLANGPAGEDHFVARGKLR